MSVRPPLSQAPQLWRTLHDLVILRILDFHPEYAGSAMARLWQSIADEQLLTDDLEGGSSVEGMTAEGARWRIDLIKSGCICRKSDTSKGA